MLRFAIRRLLDTIRGIDTLIWALVGAGGIGLPLSAQIRTDDFDQVSFIVLLILIAVAAVDRLSGRLRAAMIGRSPALA